MLASIPDLMEHGGKGYYKKYGYGKPVSYGQAAARAEEYARKADEEYMNDKGGAV